MVGIFLDLFINFIWLGSCMYTKARLLSQLLSLVWLDVCLEKNRGRSVQSSGKHCSRDAALDFSVQGSQGKYDHCGLSYRNGLIWTAACEIQNRVLLCFIVYLIFAYSTPVPNAMETNLQNRTDSCSVADSFCAETVLFVGPQTQGVGHCRARTA